MSSTDKDAGAKETAREADGILDEKRLLRRIDLVIIPWLSFLYLLCFLDRVGIGNARLYGMEEDLNITDNQYLICLTLFFIPYCLFEAPANICMRRFKPSVWLSSIILFWGIMTVVQGLVHNFGGLLVVRIMLGVFEAGFAPGATYYLSCWYKRDEIGLRLAIFASAVTTAGAFGGLLAAAISNMDGVAGKPDVLLSSSDGLLQIAGAASFFLIQDYPASAHFLSERERAFVVRRLQMDNQFSVSGEYLKWQNVRKSFMDWKVWLSSVCIIGSGTPTYAFAFFLPSIVSMLGFRATRANLLTVPVYVLASIFACIIGYVADRLRKRGFFAIGLSAVTCASFVTLVASRNKALSYFAIYVAALGIFPAGPNTTSWISNNTEGAYKRSVSMALVLTASNLTGIISTNTYRADDAPWYTPGHGVTLALAVIGHVAAIALHVLLRRENERRDRGERDEIIDDLKGGNPYNGRYDSVEAAKGDKGDEWSGYRYIT